MSQKHQIDSLNFILSRLIKTTSEIILQNKNLPPSELPNEGFFLKMLENFLYHKSHDCVAVTMNCLMQQFIQNKEINQAHWLRTATKFPFDENVEQNSIILHRFLNAKIDALLGDYKSALKSINIAISKSPKLNFTKVGENLEDKLDESFKTKNQPNLGKAINRSKSDGMKPSSRNIDELIEKLLKLRSILKFLNGDFSQNLFEGYFDKNDLGKFRAYSDLLNVVKSGNSEEFEIVLEANKDV
ncbi:hypothetical protein MHBO_003992, partial [Bonamia ostreae]